MAYSQDLRIRVIQACEEKKLTQVEIAAQFKVGIATLTRWYREYRETGRSAPRPRGGGPTPAFNASRRDQLRAFVQAKPDATLREYAAQCSAAFGVPISVDMTLRALQDMALSRKKKL